MQWLYDLKVFATDFTGLARDALHIYVALAVFFGACLLFGWKARDGRALIAVLAVALANEAADIRFNLLVENDPYIAASVHDMVNTMLVPLIIVLLARWSRVFEGRSPEAESGDEAEM